MGQWAFLVPPITLLDTVEIRERTLSYIMCRYNSLSIQKYIYTVLICTTAIAARFQKPDSLTQFLVRKGFGSDTRAELEEVGGGVEMEVEEVGGGEGRLQNHLQVTKHQCVQRTGATIQ